MNNQSNRNSEREEIELLLPWYVSGGLGLEETGRVEAYLEHHSELEQQLTALREDAEASISANEEITAQPEAALGRLLRSIEAESPGRQKSRLPSSLLSNGLMDFLNDFLRSLSPAGLSLAASTAAIVILVQAGLLVAYQWSEMPGEVTYHTASGDEKQAGVRLLIQFNSNVTHGAVGRFLSENHAEILAGPKPGGFYLVGIESGSLNEAARQELITTLGRDKTLVTLILPAQ